MRGSGMNQGHWHKLQEEASERAAREWEEGLAYERARQKAARWVDGALVVIGLAFWGLAVAGFVALWGG
jgi:hypothetical protein